MMLSPADRATSRTSLRQASKDLLAAAAFQSQQASVKELLTPRSDKPSPTSSGAAASTGLPLRALDLEKERWLDVPPLVFKSFYAVGHNMSAIKKWSDSMERNHRESVSARSKLEEKVELVASDVRANRSELKRLIDDLPSATTHLQAQVDACVVVLQQLLQCTSTFITRYGESHLEDPPLVRAAESGDPGSSAVAAADSEEEEEEERF
eukprot:TRINITY_DN754_c0_g1_i1.p1 TRINITY_DN754_c0_g1~~TRINITY_DN754_c0_g1_i1.p1  ORF type:complete len:209 (+),score=64.50 TRINITY_DN754_c0_g1_i1:107-733(+)